MIGYAIGIALIVMSIAVSFIVGAQVSEWIGGAAGKIFAVIVGWAMLLMQLRLWMELLGRFIRGRR